jgi:hypothetical protein
MKIKEGKSEKLAISLGSEVGSEGNWAGYILF